MIKFEGNPAPLSAPLAPKAAKIAKARKAVAETEKCASVISLLKRRKV